MKKTRILVAEDDGSIRTGLVDLLDGEGYAVSSAADGEQALLVHEKEKPDLIILDIMMPEKSGYDVCREIRAKDPVTPIMILTAKGQEVDKVVGLELGADDYVIKPFGVHELLARIRALLRRVRTEPASKDRPPLVFGDVEIDPRTYQGHKAGKVFAISSREIRLLHYFLQHDGEVLDRFLLLDAIWGIKYQGTTRTLDQHVAKLRQKIEDDPASPRYILTVHGVGYRFRSKPEEPS